MKALILFILVRLCSLICVHGFVTFRTVSAVHRLKSAIPEETFVQSVANNLFYSKKKFEEMGLKPLLFDALAAIEITTPSKIQWLAYPTIVSGKSTILAEQTGSGKTLAYLIPLLQNMLIRKELEKSDPIKGELQSPSIVIISPTTELAK